MVLQPKTSFGVGIAFVIGIPSMDFIGVGFGVSYGVCVVILFFLIIIVKLCRPQ